MKTVKTVKTVCENCRETNENYENGEVPISVMAKDLLTTYKYGWKTSYYQNTMDGKVEDVITDPNSAMNDYIPPMTHEEEDCDACAI